MKKTILKGFIFSFILFLLPIYANAKDNFKLKMAVSQLYSSPDMLSLLVGLAFLLQQLEGSSL